MIKGEILRGKDIREQKFGRKKGTKERIL